MNNLPHVTSLTSDASAEVVAEELEQQGCVIIQCRASTKQMDVLHDELQPYLNDAPLGRTDFAGRCSRRRNNLLAKSPACQELAIDPLVMEICDLVLGPYCVNFRLHVTALIELLPGEVPQSLHRDGEIYPLRHPAPPLTLATFWAYTDFTEENGATKIAPGSHLWDHDREPSDKELVQAVMPRGSVLLYTSSLWHGSASNMSAFPRTGLALHYNLGWLRQEEELLLSTPPKIACRYPQKLQRLIGYDLGGPYLGFVEQGNPHILLEDTGQADYARTSDELERRREELVPIPIGSIEIDDQE
ncbi:MAG: hypothetical protein CL398_10460 [Acidiferrobacteraceae bacterium]|nr:hypothetical protein [Acidiferrobacteraceae bacterium]|tara:strand:+ start:839 stop:1744 length:906 start_codon:yes stop_codon:yes gene_type:complete